MVFTLRGTTTTTTVDTTAPSFESAAADGTSLVITFDEDLAAAASLANSAFTVKKTPSGSTEETVTLSTTTGPVISGKTVTLTLATALVSTDTAVKVTYTKPTTGTANKLVDAAANETGTFTDRTVTNVSGPTDPVLVSNVGQATDDAGVAFDLGSMQEVAQRFGTGGNTTGYTLSSIELGLDVPSGTGYPTVTLHTGSAAGTKVADFTAPSTAATGVAVYAFTPTESLTLSASTTYWVRATGGDDTATWNPHNKDGGLDSTSAAGWSITPTPETRVLPLTPSTVFMVQSDAADGVALRLRVNGAINPPDATAPSFASAAANGTSLVITFDEDLAAAASLANGAFTVKKTPSGGSEATVTLSATAPVISGKTVTLTLATALVSTDTAVKVTYTKPTSGTNNKLVDAAANETGTFPDQTVTNNTPALPVITIAAGTSPVTEGTAAAFTLTRTGSATAELSVNVTVSESGDMVALTNEGAKTATFTANSATATLSVATVGDSVDEANSVVTATVDTATPATYTVGTSSSATVTVQDNDTRGVTVSAATLTVNEGSTGTYTVKLDSQPTASVTVTPSKTGSSDVTFAPASLTFSTSNWPTAQTVTVTAAQDSDAADDSATISHAVTGGDYGSVTAASVVVTVDDDETADTTAPSFASAAANGTSLVITFDEDLAAAASLANGAFTVKKTPSGGSEATVTLSATAPVISGKTVTLTLATALVSTDTAVKVTYTKPTSGTNNKLVDAAANETGTFPDQTVTNNTPALPVITIAAGTSPVTEGTAAAFTLTRTGSATAELSVNVTVSESGDMVALTNEGAKTATFTANSATATLSVATVGDSVDEANSVVTATVDTATPATYTVGTSSSATVTVQDNDTRGVTVSAATLTVNEGSTGTYTVKLDSQPTASVTVTPSKTGSSDVTFAPASLTFSTSNWPTAQTVTVTAAQDSDAADDSATISHAVTGGDYGSVTAASVVVTVDDDETADTTAPSFASAAANGASLVITFDEDLAAAASLANGAFTVKKTPSGGSEATTTLSATAPVISGKTVTLTLATALVSTDTAVKVTYTKPTSGTNNKLVDAAANETATFTDQPVTNNTPALPVITIAAGTSPVTEGTAAAFTLTRTGSTTAELSVNVTVSEIGRHGCGGQRGRQDGDLYREFGHGGAERCDGGRQVDEANSVVTATVTAAIPAIYTVGTPASATVTVQDDDTRGVTVSAATLTVNEGSTGTYTVKLDSQPTASVTVTPSKTGSSDVTFAPASLTFTKLSWPFTQTVTVTAADDSDAVDDSATISHAVTGGDYGTHSVSAGSVTVTVRDDETGGNNLPTSRSGTVTATEDTAFTLSESNFAFFDGDSGDTLASVKITELPAAGKGALRDNSDHFERTVRRSPRPSWTTASSSTARRPMPTGPGTRASSSRSTTASQTAPPRTP